MARRITDMPSECYTIPEFCAAHRIGVTLYYELKKEEPPRTPDEVRLNGKVLITKEAAARWRAARDAEARNTRVSMRRTRR